MYFQLLILAGLIYDTFSFVIFPSKVLISTRLDPLIEPGGASGHVHNIVGGNKFNATYSIGTPRSATCTTTPVTIDKSAYWAPGLYFVDQTTNPITYTRIGVSSFNIWYSPEGDPGSITAFLDNFRMLAGDNTTTTYNASSFEAQAISFACLDNNNPGVNSDHRLPTTNCPDGINAQIHFPSCWDGMHIDSPNHKDHVAYPSQGFNIGDCPSTHPQKLVSLVYEQIFNTSGFNVNGDGQSWILANGDVTGYSYHADFWNGWDPVSVLQSVIDHCHDDAGSGSMHDCPTLAPYINETLGDACQLDSTTRIPNEDVGLFHNIPALPGYNPIWLAGQSKPQNSSYVDNYSWGRVGSLDEGVGLNGTLNTTAGVQVGDPDASHWKSKGCIADSMTGRALEGVAFTDEPEMNLRKCAVLCESRGYSVAGLEFGYGCYCDNALRNGARMDLVNNLTCGTPCTGNPYENCGGSGYLVILTKDGANSAQVHGLHSYIVLTLSLVIVFLIASL